ADHPWLVQSEGKKNHRWVRADALMNDHILVRPFEPWTEHRTYDAGWIAAMFDAEGWVQNRGNRSGRTSTVGVTQVLGPTADRIAELARRYGDFTVAVRERPGRKAILSMSSNGQGVAGVARFLGSIRADRLIANFNLEGGHLVNRFG